MPVAPDWGEVVLAHGSYSSCVMTSAPQRLPPSLLLKEQEFMLQAKIREIDLSIGEMGKKWRVISLWVDFILYFARYSTRHVFKAFNKQLSCVEISFNTVSKAVLFASVQFVANLSSHALIPAHFCEQVDLLLEFQFHVFFFQEFLQFPLSCFFARW